MGKKSKSKYKDGGSYFCPALTDHDYQKIADVLHIFELTEEIRNDLQKAVQGYFANKDSQEPRSSEIRTDLLKIKKASELLLECSPTSIDLIRPKLMPESKIRSSIDNYEDCDFFDAEFFHRLHSLAMEKLERLEKDKGGRYPDSALHIFIGNLAGIYEEATGKKPGLPYKKDPVIYDKKASVIDGECTGCGKRLSVYNKGNICFACQEKQSSNKELDLEKETEIPEGPFQRFISCILEVIDSPITESTLFSAIRSTFKNLS